MLDFNSASPQGKPGFDRIEAKDIRARLGAVAESFITQLFSGRALIKKGEARIGNVKGDKGLSLSIELTGQNAGLWYDYATQEGGNLIDLYRAYMGYYGRDDFVLSLREIAHDFLGDPIDVQRPIGRPTPTEKIADAKAKFGTKPANDEPLGASIAIYHYLDVDGITLIAKVERFEPKTFIPSCYRTIDGIKRWAKGMPDVRPLYHLPAIATASEVVLVEGEGKADALAAFGVVTTSIMGGSNETAVEKTDLAPLAGKPITIWPDNDEPGLKYAGNIAAKLIALGCKVSMVPIPTGKPEKWDCGNCIKDGEDPLAVLAGAVEMPGSAAPGGPGKAGTASAGLGTNSGGTTPPPPTALEQMLQTFQNWLLLADTTPVLAVLGAIAANFLDGDPVWLGLIGPPSSAKSEILNSTSQLPKVFQAATLTPAGLLSGTPKKQQAQGAKGGLLRQVGDLGIIALKDFGSILSMRPDTKAETLAALREIFDGSWPRHLGTDGGRTLEWKGKLGLIFACTSVIDSHYGVIGSMGDRFLFCRLAPVAAGQFPQALQHAGSANRHMRQELAAAVAQLFAARSAVPRAITEDELERLDEVVSLAVRLRAPVERDRYTREIEALHGTEGTARLGLQLERLLAGLDVLGVEREQALTIVETVAMDSVPPLRRAAYEMVIGYGGTIETGKIAAALGLPTNTVRRALEDLAAYHLVKRLSQGKGQADKWSA